MLSLMVSLFLYNQQVEVVSCNEQNLIVIEENKEVIIDYFNLLFYPSKQEEMCQFVMEGNKIQIVEEKQVDRAYYLFVDNKLLQEVAIQQDWARVNVKNPQFLYASKMVKKKENTVMGKLKTEKKPSRAWIILGCCLFLMFLLVGILTKL